MKNVKNNISLDYVYRFLGNLDMSSSIWVLYLAFRGMSLAQVGLLEGIFHITSVLCEIPSGAAADLLGRRKSMIAGRICLAVSCLAMLFGRSFWIFAAAFVFQALGYNFNSGSEEALVYDSMKQCGREGEYIRVSGRLNMLTELAQAVAVVVGGILAEYSYVWCYGTSCVIAVLCVAPVFWMEEPYCGERRKSGRKAIPAVVSEHFRTCAGILRNSRQIREVLAVYSSLFAVHTVLFYYSQQYFYQMGLDKVRISLIMLLAGAVSCLGALASEKVYTFLKEKTFTAAALTIGAAVGGFGFQNIWLSVALFAAASFANSLLYPIQSVALNRLIPSEQRATLISVDSMVFSVVMVLVFPAVGVCAEIVGLGRIFAALGGIVLALAVFLHFKCRAR